jgi:hypothetical protein
MSVIAVAGRPLHARPMRETRRILVVVWDADDEALRVGIRMALDANALLSVVVPKVRVSPFVFLAPGGVSVPEQLDREAEANLRRIIASVPAAVSVTGRVGDLSGRRLREEGDGGCHDAVVVSRGGRPAGLGKRQIRKLQRAGVAADVHVVEAAAEPTLSTFVPPSTPTARCD